MDIIDPHLHFFDLAQGNYLWLRPENPPLWPDKETICHNFSEQDLTLTEQRRLSGIVHIEAGFDNQSPWREIQWLERNTAIPMKTVANIDLTLPPLDFKRALIKLKQYQSVVGVRHILDEAAETILSQPNVQENLGELAKTQLHFELQMSLADTPAIALIEAILHKQPTLTCIINHAGWPPLTTQESKQANNLINKELQQAWRKNIYLLGRLKNCAIKCSGWEMLDRHYSNDILKDVISMSIEAFGEQNVMLASNFPLTLFNKSYDALWKQYLDVLKELNLTEQTIKNLCFQNSKTWYQFTHFS